MNKTHKYSFEYADMGLLRLVTVTDEGKQLSSFTIVVDDHYELPKFDIVLFNKFIPTELQVDGRIWELIGSHNIIDKNGDPQAAALWMDGLSLVDTQSFFRDCMHL